MPIRKTLVSILLAGAITLGCDQSEKYVHATVLDESGTIVDRQKVIERSEGALFGNDSVRVGDPSYVIKIKTDDGKTYTFAVEEGHQKKLEALNFAIEKGTRVKIPKHRFTSVGGLRGTVGSIWDSELYVLDQ